MSTLAQKNKILAHFMAGRTLNASQADALYDVASLHRVISQITSAGKNVMSRRAQDGVKFYWIEQPPKGHAPGTDL